MTHDGEVWHLVGEQHNRPGYYVIECSRTGERRGSMTGDMLSRVYGMKT